MKDYKKQFIQFAIENNVLTFGSFQLKSGRISPYFFNAGKFQSGAALAKLGSFYAAALIDSGLDSQVDVLFGPAYKGIPLVSSLVVALFTEHGKDAPYAFNRKEKKDHGEGGCIVGTPLHGRVIVVDDVITAGTAIRESVDIIQREGDKAKLQAVLIALDRQEKGKDTDKSAIQQVEEEYSVPVISIVSLSDILEYLQETGTYPEAIPDIIDYRKQWGV